jgi:simple sugar transport system ATP-binding protein
MMVGRQVFFNCASPTTEKGPVFLEVRDLVVRGERGNIAVQGITLELRQKEIFGLAGVAGNGQLELCEAMVGLRGSESGEVLVQGRKMCTASPRAFLDKGIAYIPEDRKGTGLVASMNIRENVALRKYWKKPFARWRWFIDWEVVAGHTGRLVERFGVITPGLGIPIRALSGGNLQKLMLARELGDNPKAIIAVQPTWGLDVGATEYVRERLLEHRDRGAAIFLVSEDLEELFALSDRLAVIHQGRLMGITEDPRALDEEDLGLLMAGTLLEEVLRRRKERGDVLPSEPFRDPGTFFAGDGAAQKKAIRMEGEEGKTPWA